MEGKKLSWSSVVFSLLALLCAGAMLWINGKPYQGALWDSAFTMFFALAGFVIAELRRLCQPEAPAGRKLAVKKAVLTASGLFIASWMVWRLAHSLFSLEAWMCGVLLVWAVLLCLPPLRAWGRTDAVIAAVYASLLAVMLVFLVAVRPVTFAQAEQRLRESGYTDFDLFTVLHYDLHGTPEGDMGFYWFHVYQPEHVRLVKVSILTGAVTDVGAES